MSTALTVDRIGKRFGGQTVLNEVSFTVPRGSVYGLLGPNGAGKTTLFGIIAGFLRSDGGTVRVLDQAIDDPALRGRVGILPQDALFQADLPIIDQLAFFLELTGHDRRHVRRQVADALARVGLGERIGGRAGELSHGMQKRLGLAQAFLGAPDVILLDEPTAGLDPANAAGIRDLIREYRDRDATIVISSHDLAEMQALCDHVCILRQGRVVSAGPVTAIAGVVQQYRIICNRELADAQLAQWAALSDVQTIERDGGAYRVVLTAADTAAADDALGRLLGWLLAHGIVPRLVDPGNQLERHFRQVTAPDR